jgi:hypothetical protein
VSVHLSSKGRALLLRVHTLHAQVTIVASDPAGASHTTQTVVTLRAVKGKKRRKH